MLASRASHNREISANNSASVRLYGQRIHPLQSVAPADPATGNKKGFIHRTVRVEAGDRLAWHAINFVENAADKHLAIC